MFLSHAAGHIHHVAIYKYYCTQNQYQSYTRLPCSISARNEVAQSSEDTVKYFTQTNGTQQTQYYPYNVLQASKLKHSTTVPAPYFIIPYRYQL